jgi:hypothetical protein
VRHAKSKFCVFCGLDRRGYCVPGAGRVWRFIGERFRSCGSHGEFVQLAELAELADQPDFADQPYRSDVAHCTDVADLAKLADCT